MHRDPSSRAFHIQTEANVWKVCDPEAKLRHGGRVAIFFIDPDDGKRRTLLGSFWATVLTKRPVPYRRVRVLFDPPDGESEGTRQWLGPRDATCESSPVIGEIRSVL